MTDQEQPLTPDTGVVTSGLGTKTPEERKLPDSLSNDMELCLEILRGVLAEYDESLLTMFDTVRQYAVDASAERFSGVLTDTHPERDDLEMAVKTARPCVRHVFPSGEPVRGELPCVCAARARSQGGRQAGDRPRQ